MKNEPKSGQDEANNPLGAARLGEFRNVDLEKENGKPKRNLNPNGCEETVAGFKGASRRFKRFAPEIASRAIPLIGDRDGENGDEFGSFDDP